MLKNPIKRPLRYHAVYLTALTCLFLSLAIPAYTETVLSDEQHAALLGHLENLKAIETALPEITLEPIIIYRDRVGRYFLPEKVKLNLSLSYLNYEADVLLPTRIETQPRRRVRLSGRIQGGLSFDTEHGSGLVVGYELVTAWRLSLQGYATRAVLGAGVGWAVTDNSCVLIGVGLPWGDLLDMNLTNYSITVGLLLGF